MDQTAAGSKDLSAIISTNDEGFLGVEFWYRVRCPNRFCEMAEWMNINLSPRVHKILKFLTLRKSSLTLLSLWKNQQI